MLFIQKKYKMLRDKTRLAELIKGWGLDATSSGELTSGGCNSVELAKIYGTPLHVVNEARLRSTAESFIRVSKAIYPGEVSVHFAFKCNPVPGIINIIKQAGVKAEIMSEYELLLALKLGYSGREIVVNGPYKTDKLLIACLINEVRFINIDSLSELDRLESICEALKKEADVLLRINPDYIPSGMNNGSLAGSRAGSHFGLDLKGGEIHRALEKIRKMKHVRFRGFHFHIGSGIRNTNDYTKAILSLKNIVNYSEHAGFNIDVIDIGGGLGVSNSCEMSTIELLLYQGFNIHNSGKSPCRNISFTNFSNSVTKGILTIFNKKLPEIIFEPGRCITSPNQLLLLNIHQVKSRKGINKWLVADAGIGTLTMPTYYEHHEVVLCNDIHRKSSEKVTITGPGCFAADVVYRNISMPEIRPGEILAILDSGAYFTSWESSFSFPRPAIISVMNGKHKLLRTRESFVQMMSLDFF